MKIVIPGGSRPGRDRCWPARCTAEGHEVVVLSRQPRPAPWRCLPWDGVNLGDWVAELEGADVVINLAGRSVNCRYHARHRREILDSRIKSTHAVGAAIACVRRPPRVWLQASTATIYAHRYDAANDEATGVLGGTEPDTPETWQFSIEVAQAWERTFDEAMTPGTRKVKLRSAITMSPDAGGAFATSPWLGAMWPRRLDRGRWKAVRLLDSRGGFHPRCALAHRPRRMLDGTVNPCLAAPIALRRIHAHAAAGGCPCAVWIASPALASWRSPLPVAPHRTVRTRPQKPPRRSPRCAPAWHGGFEFRYPEWSMAAAALCAAYWSDRTPAIRNSLAFCGASETSDRHRAK